MTLLERYLVKIFSSKEYYNAYLKTSNIENCKVVYKEDIPFERWVNKEGNTHYNNFLYYKRKGIDNEFIRLNIPFEWSGTASDFRNNFDYYRELMIREYIDGI